MNGIEPVFVYAGVLALQYFLASRRNKNWALVLPVGLVLFMSYMFITGKREHIIATLILTIIGLLFLAEQTQKAKKETQERSRKELNKTKTQDIN